MYLSATTKLILGFKAPFKLSGGNNWVEICFKYCALILSRNTDNQSLVWKLWITKCTRANASFIGSEINMKGQAYRWPCGGWMAVREERQPAPFFNYPMHLLKKNPSFSNANQPPLVLDQGDGLRPLRKERLVATARRQLHTTWEGQRGKYRSSGSPAAQEGLWTLCFPVSDTGIMLSHSLQTRFRFTLLNSSSSPRSHLET